MSFWLGGNLLEVSQVLWLAPSWKIGLGLTLGLISLIQLYRTRRGGEKIALEMLLWSILTLVLLVLNAEPQLVSEMDSDIEGKVVFLVDSSSSMQVVEGGTSRFKRANDLVDSLATELGGASEIFYFDDEISQTKPETLGEGTDILQALQLVTDRNLGQELRGVILLTDGIDRGGLQNLFETNSSVSNLPALPGPLTIIQVGSKEKIFDESIVSVQYGGFAFQRTPFQLRTTVLGRPTSTIKVQLLKNNKVQEEKKVHLDDAGKGEVVFDIRPLEVGRFAWELQIPVDSADVVPSNNYFPVVVKVVRDEVRVLQVSGSPSYDQKFLRLFLKEDPSIDLISFFILRTHEDFSANWQADELSLIAFPYERLFSDDLASFDLVIFQNFNYAPYFTYQSQELLGNIASYVKEGGAFIMTGGNLSFDLGEYQNTPIEDILPVRLGTLEKSSEVKFVPKLSVSGASHPITKLANSEEDNLKIWQSLPEMDGYNTNFGLVSGAASLLDHPLIKTENGVPLPILSVREVEKGRTMALGIDSSWRWSYSEGIEGGGNQAYLRFWKNAIRWVIADPEDRSIVIQPSQENLKQGEEMKLLVRSRNTGYQPLANITVDVIIGFPAGGQTEISVQTDQNGEGEILFTPTEQGVYSVQAKKAIGGQDLITETVFAVSSRSAELLQLLPNDSLMEGLENGVKTLDIDTRFIRNGEDIEPVLNEAAVRRIPKRSSLDIGAAPLIFVFLACWTSMVIFLRRKWGGR